MKGARRPSSASVSGGGEAGPGGGRGPAPNAPASRLHGGAGLSAARLRRRSRNRRPAPRPPPSIIRRAQRSAWFLSPRGSAANAGGFAPTGGAATREGLGKTKKLTPAPVPPLALHKSSEGRALPGGFWRWHSGTRSPQVSQVKRPHQKTGPCQFCKVQVSCRGVPSAWQEISDTRKCPGGSMGFDWRALLLPAILPTWLTLRYLSCRGGPGDADGEGDADCGFLVHIYVRNL